MSATCAHRLLAETWSWSGRRLTSSPVPGVPGLAANGQAGVENVLDILRGGIDSALLGSADPPFMP
jgi:hypothetical protein